MAIENEVAVSEPRLGKEEEMSIPCIFLCTMQSTDGTSQHPLDANIQLIPLEPLLSTTSSTSTSTTTSSSTQKTATAKALLSAFHNYGFLYLTAYSSLIPPDLIARVFSQSAHFFSLPLSTKEKVAWTTPRANRGYTSMGKEKVSNGMTREEVEKSIAEEGGDLKESFEIGREGEEGYPNRWWKKDNVTGGDDNDNGTTASAAAEFKATMTEFFDRCKEVHRVLMRGIAIALGLDEDHFDGFVKTGDNTLRLLHYPPVAPGGFAGGKRVRAGAHSDYGTLTLLFQDSRGGLQIDPPASAKTRGRWIDVVPIEGAIVVNAGDLLARWSNDLIRSTAHRVVEPPSSTSSGNTADTGHPARYSVAYFCHPDFDRWIEAIPGTGESKYEGVNSGEYVVKRLSATY